MYNSIIDSREEPRRGLRADHERSLAAYPIACSPEVFLTRPASPPRRGFLLPQRRPTEASSDQYRKKSSTHLVWDDKQKAQLQDIQKKCEDLRDFIAQSKEKISKLNPGNKATVPLITVNKVAPILAPVEEKIDVVDKVDEVVPLSGLNVQLKRVRNDICTTVDRGQRWNLFQTQCMIKGIDRKSVV